MHLEGPNTQIKAQMHLEMQTSKFQMHSLTLFSVYFFLLFFLLFSFFFNCCFKLSGIRKGQSCRNFHMVLPLCHRELQNTFSLTPCCLVTHQEIAVQNAVIHIQSSECIWVLLCGVQMHLGFGEPPNAFGRVQMHLGARCVCLDGNRYTHRWL